MSIITTEKVHLFDLFCGRQGSVYPTVNAIAVDDLLMQGAMASAAMAMNQLLQNITV